MRRAALHLWRPAAACQCCRWRSAWQRSAGQRSAWQRSAGQWPAWQRSALVGSLGGPCGAPRLPRLIRARRGDADLVAAAAHAAAPSRGLCSRASGRPVPPRFRRLHWPRRWPSGGGQWRRGSSVRERRAAVRRPRDVRDRFGRQHRQQPEPARRRPGWWRPGRRHAERWRRRATAALERCDACSPPAHDAVVCAERARPDAHPALRPRRRDRRRRSDRRRAHDRAWRRPGGGRCRRTRGGAPDGLRRPGAAKVGGWRLLRGGAARDGGRSRGGRRRACGRHRQPRWYLRGPLRGPRCRRISTGRPTPPSPAAFAVGCGGLNCRRGVRGDIRWRAQQQRRLGGALSHATRGRRFRRCDAAA